MKTKWVDKTADSQMIAVMELSFPEISFLHHAVNMYIERDFGDTDDRKEVKLKHEVKEDLVQAMKTLRGDHDATK